MSRKHAKVAHVREGFALAEQGSRLARLRLGRELRGIRDSKGLTQKRVADLLEISLRKLQMIEGGDTGVAITRADIVNICDVYEVSRHVRDALLTLAAGARTGGDDWAAAALPGWVPLLLDLEGAAGERETWQPGNIHGLVQTEDYYRALLATEGGLSEATVEQRVRVRQERQTRALAHGRMTVILGAAALAREVGSRDVMRTQIAHLRELNQLDNVTIKVIPFAAGAHIAMQEPFTIFSFRGGIYPDIVYVETLHTASYLEKQEHLGLYRGAFAELHAIARPIEEEYS